MYQQCSKLTVIFETATQTEHDVKICEPTNDFNSQTDEKLTKNQTFEISQQTQESSFCGKIDQFCQFPELVAKILPVGVTWECAKPLVQLATLPALALVKRESSSLKKLVSVNKHALKTTSVPIVQSPRLERKKRYLQFSMLSPQEAQLRASILNEYLENYLESRQAGDNVPRGVERKSSHKLGGMSQQQHANINKVFFLATVEHHY